jgi:hypothetical protein
LSDELLAKKQTKLAAAIWEQVSADSPLRARAGRYQANMLLWHTGDFGAALKVLEPLAKATTADEATKRTYAQSLILNQKFDEGAAILKSLSGKGLAVNHAAQSGAMARTIEFYITEGDAEAGEAAWETWQEKYPADFLDGYSAVLKVKLMELKKSPEGAANVAEAFARAVPKSSYAPQLLNRASELLEKSDPERSKALRQMLKTRYPEDPLSQDAPNP